MSGQLTFGGGALNIPSAFALLESNSQVSDPDRSASIGRILAKCDEPAPAKISSDGAHWDANFYQLDRSSAFTSLNTEAKQSLLSSCGQSLLQEAQLIEVAGTVYTAKMALLAENFQERQLYGFFAADEVRHLRLINALIGHEPRPQFVEGNSFLKYLSDLIQQEERAPLIFLIQVILEGWGIHHYTSLAQNSLSAPVAQAFHAIVKDEARHHGSGLVLFDEAALGETEMKRLESLVAEFLTMVRTGPFMLVQQLFVACGGLTQTQIESSLDEIRFQEKLASDLEVLRNLLAKSGAHRLLEKMLRREMFSLPSASECARTMQSALGEAV